MASLISRRLPNSIPTAAILTFAIVLLAQVFFRASGIHDAFAFLAALAGRHHAVPTFSFNPGRNALVEIAAGFVIVWCFPNTQQILANFKPALEVTGADRKSSLIYFVWHPNAA